MTIRIAVSGSGRMGQAVLGAVGAAPDCEVAGVLDPLVPGERIALPDGAGEAPLSQAPHALRDWQADVVVDFSHATWTQALLLTAVEAGVRPVIGTTGLPEELIRAATSRCAAGGLGGAIAPNFALGAVLMTHLARIAAPYFESAEIVERHHDAKVDAPSGTAVGTARAMRDARETDFARNVPERETVPGARGATLGGVSLHALRLPGSVAHQEVLFGGTGETLTIRHDSLSRESFMPGVLLAAREVMTMDHLVVGLDRLLGLTD